ncbi:uncharacterized protein LOC132202938 [Neocloeon triangulifer]|uniref:uncharacterized protein LOC132202938 n=1 Tax=Neocloeon triangulifer TaxID=2078957 RepID=UPI00286EE3A7|nr:uncharacterized protein LOC132202938 [Neocloeon triangulifer]
MSEENVQELKERGNACVKEGKFEEAVLHYTHALSIEPGNFSLHSNRSLAFLRMRHFFLALQDADETVKLNPTWAKGYFRRAEVQFATFHFAEALQSYRQALLLQPDDASIAGAIARTTHECHKDKKADDQIPWLGAGIGIILGVIIVIADQIATAKPSLSHPILMVLTTMGVAMVGYALARGFRHYVKCQRKALLEPPPDLSARPHPEDEGEDEEVPEGKTHTPRYSKAQARQRFKKGKSS